MADSLLYPTFGAGSQGNSGGFGQPQQSNSNNLQYYNPNYGQPAQGQQPFGGLNGINIMSQVGDAALGPMGQHVMSSGKQYVNENFGRFMTLSPLKYYFNVNNSYVINKLRLVAFPFFHKQWKRRIVRVSEVDGFAIPREDINAPDLYIPTMAFVTYILLVGFIHGTISQFTPDVLGITASKGMAFMTLELMAIKLAFYLFNCGGVAILDILGYCGYLFVGVVGRMFIGFIFGGYLDFIFTLYFGASVGFYLMRTLRLVMVFEVTRSNAVEMPGSYTSKNYFLLCVAALQVLLVYYLGGV